MRVVLQFREGDLKYESLSSAFIAFSYHDVFVFIWFVDKILNRTEFYGRIFI